MRYVNDKKQRIIEGELRCKELVEYMDNLKLDKHVWISEDGTGIVSKIEFDPKTNQLVGLVLPIDSRHGMPIPFTFLARSAEEIHTNMKNSLSSLVYIVLAQPIKKNVPPFVLQIFGTDNKFRTQNVLQRWKHTLLQCKK